MGDNTLGLQEDLRDVTTAYLDRLYESIPSISERGVSNQKISNAFQEGSMSGVMGELGKLIGIVGENYMEGDDEFKARLSGNKMSDLFIKNVETPLKSYFKKVKELIDDSDYLSALDIDIQNLVDTLSSEINTLITTAREAGDRLREEAAAALRSISGGATSYAPSSRPSNRFAPLESGTDLRGLMSSLDNRKQQNPFLFEFTINNKSTFNGVKQPDQITRLKTTYEDAEAAKRLKFGDV